MTITNPATTTKPSAAYDAAVKAMQNALHVAESWDGKSVRDLSAIVYARDALKKITSPAEFEAVISDKCGAEAGDMDGSILAALHEISTLPLDWPQDQAIDSLIAFDKAGYFLCFDDNSRHGHRQFWWSLNHSGFTIYQFGTDHAEPFSGTASAIS